MTEIRCPKCGSEAIERNEWYPGVWECTSYSCDCPKFTSWQQSRIQALEEGLRTAMQIIQPNFSGHIQTECQCGVCEWIRLAAKLIGGGK